MPALIGIVLTALPLRAVAHTGGAGHAAQANGTEYAFALSDTGTTLHVGVGDKIALRFGAVRGLSLSGPDPAILASQSATGADNALFSAAAPGTTTIDATGGPPCPGPICPAIAFVFRVTIVVTQAPPARQSVSYAPGWNLVSLPPTGRLPVDAFGWDVDKGVYTPVTAGDALVPGHGYWAYFTQATTLPLPAATHDPIQLGAANAAWLLVGDPNGADPATVSGATAVLTWDATAQRYVEASTLPAGSAAWAYTTGGNVTVGAPP
ncbi:MAG TPA: hypothetical protein VFD32_00125 [Dehalococcoidia bacterium]|nr:hypothetical protein [Dehalococcoidia bacterium]